MALSRAVRWLWPAALPVLQRLQISLPVLRPTVTQTTRLIAWVIVGLISVGILLYVFGPSALRIDELIIVGLLIIRLIWFQVRLRRRSV
ncbi:MAG: hypothetical protein WAV38_39485 [Xanthobacteraceae bacterium]